MIHKILLWIRHSYFRESLYSGIIFCGIRKHLIFRESKYYFINTELSKCMRYDLFYIMVFLTLWSPMLHKQILVTIKWLMMINNAKYQPCFPLPHCNPPQPQANQFSHFVIDDMLSGQYSRVDLWSLKLHALLCIRGYFCCSPHYCIGDEYASTYTLFIGLHFVCMHSLKDIAQCGLMNSSKLW